MGLVIFLTPLLGACIEEANTTARDGEVKLTLSDIRAYIGGLYNHLLSSNRGGSEGKPMISSEKLIRNESRRETYW